MHWHGRKRDENGSPQSGCGCRSSGGDAYRKHSSIRSWRKQGCHLDCCGTCHGRLRRRPHFGAGITRAAGACGLRHEKFYSRGTRHVLRELRRLKMAKKFPIHPSNPERVCWGCDKYCPADSMACGNGSERTQHPAELFGDDWQEWGCDFNENGADAKKS